MNIIIIYLKIISEIPGLINKEMVVMMLVLCFGLDLKSHRAGGGGGGGGSTTPWMRSH